MNFSVSENNIERRRNDGRKRASLLLIEDSEIVKKILKHLGLWNKKARPPLKANSPQMTPEYHIDYTDSQLPVTDNYLYVDPVYPEIYPT